MQQRSERFSNKAELTAFLGAFCFFLSAIEYMLPKPLPFMRLGIANLPILIAVDILNFRWFLVLAVVKVIGMSIISGTLFSYIALFSLAGTMAAALSMWGLRHAGGRFISQIGVSIAGAMVSNAAQIFIARFLVFRETAWLIAPLFLTMGLITGAALGLFAQRFVLVSSWYALAAGLPLPERPNNTPSPEGAEKTSKKSRKSESQQARKQKSIMARALRREKAVRFFPPSALAIAGIIVMVAFLTMNNLAAKTIMLLVFIAAASAMGKRFSLITTLSVSAGIVLANLLIPSGRIMTTLWGFRITEGALLEGLNRAITFEGLMYISKASIMPGLSLPGRIGGIVAAAFGYYERVLEFKGRIRPATVAIDADGLMMRVWESTSVTSNTTPDAGKVPQAPPLASKTIAIGILSLASVSAWALALFLR